MKNLKRWRVVVCAALLIWMTVIFGFSAQGTEQSQRTSGRFSGPITELLLRGRQVSQEEYQQVYDAVEHGVRKTAHFLEYAVLGGLACLLAFFCLRRRPWLWAWIGGTLYAASDELHQLLGGERAGMWQDVALDSVGALTGGALVCLAAWLIARAAARRAEKR